MVALMFPAAVGPKPKVRHLIDFGFESSHTQLRQFVIGKLPHIGSEPFEVALIIASARTGYADKVGRRSDFLSDALSSGKDGSVLMQEGHPVVNAIRSRTLVGNKADV